MAVERQFVTENIKKAEIKEFLKKELERAGCGNIEILRTPLGTRVIAYAQRPGIVIGRKGASIKKLTNVLKEKYGLDNPQIEVNELDNPELNAQIMSRDVASSIERGFHFRRAAYTTLQRIIRAGAIGAQIEISGKLTGERSRTEKFLSGYIKHCGEPAEIYVRKGYSRAAPKQGVIGVKVKIMPPDISLPDDITFIEEEKGEPPVEAPKGIEVLDQNAKAVIKGIGEGDFSEKEIEELINAETENKNRKTVIGALKKRIEKGKNGDTEK